MNSWSSKKPSLVTAGACVLIIQTFQLSSSGQFYARSRLPCPCRPESRKQNTCEPASVSCSPCRSILPCRQVPPSDRYLCAFILCVLLIFFLYFEQFLDFRFTRRPYCLFIIVCYRSAVGASIRQFLSREAVAAGIAKVVVQVIFTPISNISSNAIMVGSSLPVSFIEPV